MSRASTITKLPLANWARIFGMHPLHFEQVTIAGNPVGCPAGEIFFQHEWQNNDHVSREEIARAIAEAEYKLEAYLGYHLAPAWDVDEWRPGPSHYKPELLNYFMSDARGLGQTVHANFGYLISGGIQSKSLIEADAAIVYTDVDSDGYFETATVTVNTNVVDINEIGAFYPGKSGDDAWEIRPIEVSISAGVATITFRRELAVIPDFFDKLVFAEDEESADGLDNDHFLDSVDIYRRYNDPQTQVSMLWEPLATGNCNVCNGTGCPSCAYTAQAGCLVLRGDPRQSIVAYHPANWNSETLEFDRANWSVARQPDIVRLYYYSGWRNKSQRYISRLAPEWERIIAYMSVALLDRPPCDCTRGDWQKWRQDLTLVAGDEDGKPFYREPTDRYSNPFGTRRGEIYAWERVQKLAVGQSVSFV